METVKIEVKSIEKASRLELFIRFVWGTIVAIVLMVIWFFISIVWIVEWLHMLIFGKRHIGLAKIINAWLIAWSKMMFYNNLATDERPSPIPHF